MFDLLAEMGKGKNNNSGGPGSGNPNNGSQEVMLPSEKEKVAKVIIWRLCGVRCFQPFETILYEIKSPQRQKSLDSI